MKELILSKETMSSVEIAELTGKRHDHVIRDIRNLLAQGVAAPNFGEGTYKDANQQDRPCFNLTKKGCLILASGYDATYEPKLLIVGKNLKKTSVSFPVKGRNFC